MIDHVPAETANAERFERLGLDPQAETVSRTRHEFAQWLHRFFDLDPIRSSDLVLAINEALANAVEFAYLLADRPGTIDLQATYSDEQMLTVRICDRGTWRKRQTDHVPRNRGRGIPLMEALSDRATIETSADGTRVHLEWTGIKQV